MSAESLDVAPSPPDSSPPRSPDCDAARLPLTHKPALPAKTFLANLNKGTSLDALESQCDVEMSRFETTSLNDLSLNHADVQSQCSAVCASSGELETADWLLLGRNTRPAAVRPEHIALTHIVRTLSVRAVPPQDDNELRYVPEKASPVSFCDSELGGVDVRRSVGGLFCVEGALATAVMPPVPVQELPVQYMTMQNSIRIEPSPERVLEPPSTPVLAPAEQEIPVGEEEEEAGSAGETRQPTYVNVSDSAPTVCEAEEPTNRPDIAVNRPDIEQKLDRFFGETKKGVTPIEAMVYNELLLGPKQPSPSGGGATHDTKLKKSSAWSLSSKLSLHPSSNQLKLPRKAELDLTPPRAKEHTTTWRGKVARRFRRSPLATEPTAPEDMATVTFGAPLEECTTSARAELVPLIVEVCAHIVEEQCTGSAGVYRVPGQSRAVTELVEEVDGGAPGSISMASERWSDVNVVASLLKLFLRRLPEALVTDALYDSVIAAARLAHAEKSALRLKRLLRDLPEQNRATLHFLMRHLARIAQHQDTTKMDAHNLAIMFGPSLVRPSTESMTNMVRDIDDQSGVIERLIRHVDWYFGDWTEEADAPVPLRPFDSSALGSNLQLLANAESLVAAQPVPDGVPGGPMGGTQDEDAPSAGFFNLGSGRHSRRNKNKVDKDAKEDPPTADLNREVQLKRVRVAGHAGVKVKDTSPALTRVDLARKVSLSVTSNKKIKRRYTERVGQRTQRALSGSSAHEGKDRGGTHGGKDQGKDKARVREEDVNQDRVRDMDAVPPPGQGVADKEAEVEIRRYPAYNFVDTTIKRSMRGPHIAEPEEPRAVSPPARSHVIGHSASAIAFPPSKVPKSPVVGTRDAAWELSGGVEGEGGREGEKEDEVFHSDPLAGAALSPGVSTPSGLSPAVLRARALVSHSGGAQRLKRFSETDASRYAPRPLGAMPPIITGPPGAVPPSITDASSLARSHRYNVVIRAPEGRHYYVLETTRPSVFFGRQDSLSASGRRPHAVAERLPPDQLMMTRVEPRGDTGCNGPRGCESMDEVPLRRYLYGIDCTAVTSV